MKPRFAVAAFLAALAVPSLAQNAAEPVIVTPPPPAKGETPPATNTSPPATTAPEPAEAPPVVVVPQAPPPPPVEPVTIDPDVAYPNGFADPADPFGNDLSLAYQEERGFDWGLLGLLGLFGLVPLFRRGDRYVRTVYVDREEPARVIRDEKRED